MVSGLIARSEELSKSLDNALERAIRCIKVKQKVSAQFKTSRGAHQYAMIRSIIDTSRKQNKRVHENLVEVANFDSG
jgi:transposase